MMRKKDFVKKKGRAAVNLRRGEKFEALDLYVIQSESLYTIFDIVPNLSPAERRTLYVSYFKKEPLGKCLDVSVTGPTEMAECRQKALEKICHGILRNEIHIIFKQPYAADKNMKHSLFREYIDDYLADELPPDEKAIFENHMLACDFCGFLLLINRDIVKVLDKCGEALFEEIQDSTNLVPHEIEQGDDSISNESPSGKMERVMKQWRGKFHRYPQHLVLGLIFLQEDGLRFLQTFSRFIRNGSLFSHIMRIAGMIEALILRFLIP